MKRSTIWCLVLNSWTSRTAIWQTIPPSRCGFTAEATVGTAVRIYSVELRVTPGIESAEMELSSHDPPTVANDVISVTRWSGQYFQPTLPAEASELEGDACPVFSPDKESRHDVRCRPGTATSIRWVGAPDDDGPRVVRTQRVRSDQGLQRGKSTRSQTCWGSHQPRIVLDH